MKKMTKARRTLRAFLIGGALFLPTLTLLPLGSLWLWEHGFLVHWAIATALCVSLFYLLERKFLRTLDAETAEGAARASGAISGPVDASWSPIEEQAWTDVRAIAAGLDPEKLYDRDQISALGVKTIEAVANRLHTGTDDPLWQFTLPEALAITERVSARMRVFVNDNIPLGDRLKVSQILALYRWRGALDMAERAYDIWRVIRLANPVVAATNEARERLSKELMRMGRERIARRIAEAFVEEVGRAAIDLYSGRLRVSDARLAERDATAFEEPATREPLRILVTGQVSAGKSSLINALAQSVEAAVDVLPATSQFTSYELKRDGLPAAILIDSPGLGTSPSELELWLGKASECDLVLWVVPAHRADREIDRRALEAFRSFYARNLNRRRPPVILVLTQVDRLRPVAEWHPPYGGDNLAAAKIEKARSIGSSLTAAASDLGFDAEDTVAVANPPGRPSDGIESLWATIARELPEAQGAQLVRRLQTLKDDWSWSRLWTQLGNAGRGLARSARKS